jgi:predicted nucleic acid-binding protein
MATEVVIDSSAIVALVTPEEHSTWAMKKTSEQDYCHILDLTYYEVANAIKFKTPNQLTKQNAEKAFTNAIHIMDLFGAHSFGDIVIDDMALALKLNISVYALRLFHLQKNWACSCLRLMLSWRIAEGTNT